MRLTRLLESQLSHRYHREKLTSVHSQWADHFSILTERSNRSDSDAPCHQPWNFNLQRQFNINVKV